MGTFKVEKGVPMPGRRGKYPFDEMEVGDSFLADARAARRVRSAASEWSKKHPGVKFKTRAVDGGVRVWRVE